MRDKQDHKHEDSWQRCSQCKATACVSNSAGGGPTTLDAEAAVSLAELNLEFTKLRAPIDRRAGRAMLTVGNLAVAHQTLLTTMISQDPVYVDYDPDEQSYLRYSMHARQDTTLLPVRVGLANEERYPRAGTLYFIDNQLDPTTGFLTTAEVEAVARRREGRRGLVLAPDAPIAVDVHYDLRNRPDSGTGHEIMVRLGLIGDAMNVCFGSGKRTMRVLGSLGQNPDDFIEVVMPEAPLRSARAA